MDIQNILNGKLTYLAGAAFILVGVVQLLQALAATQNPDYNSGIQNIIGGFAILGGRRAIGKITIGNQP